MSSASSVRLRDREQTTGRKAERSSDQEVREVINAKELADQKLAQLHIESEAAGLARSVRRARARTLRHNRRVLRVPAGWRLIER
jgi:hypothetical protein